jgi:2-phosphosulfolactate phosphatase
VSVIIDSFPSGNQRYFRDYAIVAIDVIRASTTAVTAAAAGRRCFPVVSVEEAFQKRGQFPDCLLAGEVAGLKPDGFDLNNSPANLACRCDYQRPLVLLSSSGTKLMVQSSTCTDVYVGCLRNYKATAAYVAGRHERIALLGAATRGEFREEDQLCCAWIASELVRLGHAPENPRTLNLIEQWRTTSARACGCGNSAAYLRRSGQLDDLNFILSHVNDVPLAFRLTDGEVLPTAMTPEIAEAKQPAETQSPMAA